MNLPMTLEQVSRSVFVLNPSGTYDVGILPRYVIFIFLLRLLFLTRYIYL